MATHKLLLLPGDGIGPEVMGEVQRLIDWLNKQGIASFETEQGLVGGSAYDAHKVSISEGDMAKAKDAEQLKKQVPIRWDGTVYDRVWRFTFDDAGNTTFTDEPQKLLFGDSPK